jgi:hypothetical protein
VRATYDTDAMRAAATRLRNAACRLDEVQDTLRGVVAGSTPRSVDAALNELGKRGGDMIRDIREESSALAQGLELAAARYDDVDNSLVTYFRSGP